MLTTVVFSLLGGQGKTTCCLFLGYQLAEQGYSTLLVDTDPLYELTTYLNINLQAGRPTLAEVLKGKAKVEQAIYAVEGSENLFLLPAGPSLAEIETDFARGVLTASRLLRNCLQEVLSRIDVCVIDTPPQRSFLNQVVFGAADAIVLPVEASVKGYSSLIHTLNFLEGLQQQGEKAEILGVMAFRDRWIGSRQSQESRIAVESFLEEVGVEQMLPSIRESEIYKQAINLGTTPKQLGHPELEYPFEILAQRIQKRLEGEK